MAVRQQAADLYPSAAVTKQITLSDRLSPFAAQQSPPHQVCRLRPDSNWDCLRKSLTPLRDCLRTLNVCSVLWHLFDLGWVPVDYLQAENQPCPAPFIGVGGHMAPNTRCVLGTHF